MSDDDFERIMQDVTDESPTEGIRTLLTLLHDGNLSLCAQRPLAQWVAGLVVENAKYKAMAEWALGHGTEFDGWEGSRKKFVHLEYTAATIKSRLAAAEEAVQPIPPREGSE